ncbi:uncharacterized protein ISCGN_009620 [Ixodes scapularis]
MSRHVVPPLPPVVATEEFPRQPQAGPGEDRNRRPTPGRDIRRREGQLVPGSTDPRSQREESGSAPLPGVAASTRRRATCSVNNGSDGRSPILNAKAKPRRVEKKGRRRKDVTFAKAYRNNPQTPERSHSPDTPLRTDAPATVSNNLNVVIDGIDASALVDTGADYSVLSGRLSRRLRKVTTPWNGPQIRTAGGHLITPVGRCTARVKIHGETCPVKFVILQDCARDVILGMDFLCEYGAVIDLGENRLTLRTPVPPSERPQTASAAVRVAADHVNLPPRSSVVVPVVTDAATCGEVVLEGDLQLLLGRGIGVARGVAELQDGRTVVLVTNFRQETQHLTKGGIRYGLPGKAAVTVGDIPAEAIEVLSL